MYMTTLQEVPSSPINPFKEARECIIDSDTGRSISHAVLAKRIGVTKLSLIRLEQGTFNDPLPTVLNYFCNNGFNYLALTDGYINFQYQMRAANAYYFGLDLECDPSVELHPFAQLRMKALNQPNHMKVAKDLCLPQSSIHLFETKPRSQKSVPKTIINVLPVLGYSDQQISDFLACYKDWRARMLGKNVLNLVVEAR